MKRLMLLCGVGLLLVTVIFTGCVQQTAAKGPDADVVNSCIACHTDKDTLQELAVELEEKSEETKGEG